MQEWVVQRPDYNGLVNVFVRQEANGEKWLVVAVRGRFAGEAIEGEGRESRVLRIEGRDGGHLNRGSGNA